MKCECGHREMEHDDLNRICLVDNCPCMFFEEKELRTSKEKTE